MIRILFYFFRLENSSGGAERMLLRLATDMGKRGHDVHVVSWDSPNANAFYPIPEGAVWHRLGFSAGLWDKVRRTWALARLLSRLRCDVFVGFVMGADKSVYVANLFAGVPIVAAERNSPEMYFLKLGRLARYVYLALFLLARRIVVQIDEYRQGYPKWLWGRITAISNPIDQAQVSALPARRGNNGWVLLCVARLENQKNVEALINAFSILSPDFPEWRLRIVGEGNCRTSLERLVSDLKLTTSVSLPGASNRVGDEYANAHLFCLPSRWEGFPNALAEAMAHGLPAVGFAQCPGVNSLIHHGVDGLLATGGDAFELSRALRVLMADSAMRERMGASASLQSQRSSPERIVDEWEKVLLEVSCRHA